MDPQNRPKLYCPDSLFSIDSTGKIRAKRQAKNKMIVSSGLYASTF